MIMPDFAMPALKPGERIILSDGDCRENIDVFWEYDYGDDIRGAIRNACGIWEGLDDRQREYRVIEVLVVGPEHGDEARNIVDIRARLARFGTEDLARI